MRNTRKLLLLPVVAVASAAVVLFSNLSLSVAGVPAAPDEAAVTDSADGVALTVKDWNETAGSNNKKGGAGGANGSKGCPIRR